MAAAEASAQTEQTGLGPGIYEFRWRKRMIENENNFSAPGAENRRETGKPTRADRLAEIGKRTRFKPGQKSANPAGRPRTAKFSEAMRQILAEVNPSSGETNAERLARHCFQKAIAGSARHLGLALSYVEGKPPQAFELSGRNSRAIELANMTEAELDARLRELLGIVEPAIDDVGLQPAPAAVLPPVAPAIDNSIAAMAPATRPLPALVAPASQPAPAGTAELTGEERDKEFSKYLTRAVVAGPAARY
jgi:Family of unknown function (DUF5681)